MVTINIGRKEAVFFGVVILVLAVVGFGVAAWDDNKVMYHEGADVKVVFNGSVLSLNEALSMINAGGGFGGGSGGMSFGDWESKNSNQEYGPVTSDGFVIAYYSREINRDMQGFTGSTSGSLIMRHRSEVSTGNRESNTFTMPVKSGNYWEVTGATTVYWLPLISSGGSGGIDIVTGVQDNSNQPSVSLSLSPGEWLVEVNVIVTSGGSVTARNIVINGANAGTISSVANRDGDVTGFGTAFRTVNVASTRNVVSTVDGTLAATLRSSVLSVKAIRVGA